MTPYERLMAEAIPTGRFGDPDPDSPPRKTSAPASTPEQQAARRALLDEAQRDWRLEDERAQADRARPRNRTRPPAPARPRHLRLVAGQDDHRAA